MNVMITGYGRMGREIENILIQRGHSIALRVDKGGYGDCTEVTADGLKGVDVVIEFSLPQGIENNIRLYAQSKTPVVIGTTGWDDKKDIIKDIILNNKSTLLYGSNFSVGAHIFFDLVSKAAGLINNTPEYDIMMLEYHHNKKKDSPSGTALTTAEKILKNNNRKEKIWTDKLDRAIDDNELHVASVRGGQIPGIHTVTLDSFADSIQITHNARNRSGFALGAVMASEWLQDKKGFFTVEDFIEELLKK
ncbi:4-hydroxy-tetrahydrodipicolinate reductase [Thiospirochaeta perfilievii]|uniref:4-hydroxy-tetrahydrodipicolinate reductase n=1 Tax=Thiospirochaeta perfilievii TaxID=252967 RepID=A0A5C1QGI2_9SPIO|nr:4-hydroxy-tetrahydrodipicolinate reductase [Thiospirochaeta perfilievii]QEN05724.1 4-hydroxy-tetrahydrodipicolinate reductase [Thiospirochaeta perfilievii]